MKLVLVILLLWIPAAHAYVDPGLGMLAWQGLIAGLGALIIFVRKPLSLLKRLIDRFKRK